MLGACPLFLVQHPYEPNLLGFSPHQQPQLIHEIHQGHLIRDPSLKRIWTWPFSQGIVGCTPTNVPQLLGVHPIVPWFSCLFKRHAKKLLSISMYLYLSPCLFIHLSICVSIYVIYVYIYIHISSSYRWTRMDFHAYIVHFIDLNSLSWIPVRTPKNNKSHFCKTTFPVNSIH